MSKLSLKVLLGVFALMFSASVGLSAECRDDPNECTPKNLCEVATQVINDNKVWSEDATAAKHIAFVKELGMECGVVEITDPCDLDPNECKVKQLCEKATTDDDGSKSWNAEAEAYVELAKEYGLECGVEPYKDHSLLSSVQAVNYKSVTELVVEDQIDISDGFNMSMILQRCAAVIGALDLWSSEYHGRKDNLVEYSSHLVIMAMMQMAETRGLSSKDEAIQNEVGKAFARYVQIYAEDMERQQIATGSIMSKMVDSDLKICTRLFENNF